MKGIKFLAHLSKCHVLRTLWHYDERVQKREGRTYPSHVERWKILSIMCHYVRMGPREARKAFLLRWPALSSFARAHIEESTRSPTVYIQVCTFACRCGYCRSAFRVVRVGNHIGVVSQSPPSENGEAIQQESTKQDSSGTGPGVKVKREDTS